MTISKISKQQQGFLIDVQGANFRFCNGHFRFSRLVNDLRDDAFVSWTDLRDADAMTSTVNKSEARIVCVRVCVCGGAGDGGDHEKGKRGRIIIIKSDKIRHLHKMDIIISTTTLEVHQVDDNNFHNYPNRNLITAAKTLRHFFKRTALHSEEVGATRRRWRGVQKTLMTAASTRMSPRFRKECKKKGRGRNKTEAFFRNGLFNCPLRLDFGLGPLYTHSSGIPSSPLSTFVQFVLHRTLPPF